MKAVPINHSFYDDLKFGETECALAVSPCPQIEESKDTGEDAQSAHERSGLDRRRQAQSSCQSVFDDQDLTETLTIGWAIALAIAVALAVFVSGG